MMSTSAANVKDPESVGTLLSEVEPESVKWLWPGRIPKGKLSLIEGDPGTGKSALTIDLAARVSVGGELPDGMGCEAAGVVLISAEDGPADTIRPRLDAAGADPSKVLALGFVPFAERQERLLSLPSDIPLIERGIERVSAGLVVIDPSWPSCPGTWTPIRTKMCGVRWLRSPGWRRGRVPRSWR